MTQGKSITGSEIKIPRWVKFIYGSGDWGRASFNTLRMVFYAIFLTDVVGLDARLASVAALIGIIWDAINDPIIGALSDNARTKWGRRRPFLLLFSVPFALAFILLWWAPPWETQSMLMVHVTLAYMVSDTLQTLVSVPYLSLTPEIAPGYDERTSLTTIRMFFNLLASLVTAVAAPAIVDAVMISGATLQQGYLTVAALFGGLAVIPFLLIFIYVKEADTSEMPQEQANPLFETLKVLWSNIPFRYITGVYVLNWVAFDIISAILPFYLLYWLAGGNMLEKVDVFGAQISLESVCLGLLLITATAVLPLWNWLARKFSKRSAYITGMGFWVLIELLILAVQPHQMAFMVAFSILAGISVSTAHVMPDAIFPDVIDWDELKTNNRREGTYYGAINLIRKFSGAIAIFITLQVLGWFGYQTPPEGVSVFVQSPETLMAIRILAGPVIAMLLVVAIVLAWFYPLNRERQNRIRRSILRRRKEAKHT
jgi:GPH family glycoside/pentoside/hexuronide:cation symporter